MNNRLYLSLAVVALLCLAGWTAHAQSQRSSPVRQAWEHKTLVYQYGDRSKTTLHEDTKLLPASSSPVSVAPELGAQGWELVSVTGTVTKYGVTNSAESFSYVYWFKRPR